jgi:Tol biopolymer transport system component
MLVPYVAAYQIAASSASSSRPHPTSVKVLKKDADDPFPCPQGRYLMFDSTQGGSQQLYRLDLIAHSVAQLTRDPGSHEMPAYSHDCSQIAYVSNRSGTNQIMVMDGFGRFKKQITTGQMDQIHPAWSPDDSHIMFSVSLPTPQGIDAIYVAKADGSSDKRLTPLTFGESSYGSWSPDGRWIVYRRNIAAGNSEIFLMRSNGTAQHNLTQNRAFDGWPSWSPDGLRIAFASNRLDSNPKSLKTQIFIMNRDGRSIALVAKTDGRDTEPRWSSDGGSLYWAHCVHHACVILTAKVR